MNEQKKIYIQTPVGGLFQIVRNTLASHQSQCSLKQVCRPLSKINPDSEILMFAMIWPSTVGIEVLVSECRRFHQKSNTVNKNVAICFSKNIRSKEVKSWESELWSSLCCTFFTWMICLTAELAPSVNIMLYKLIDKVCNNRKNISEVSIFNSLESAVYQSGSAGYPSRRRIKSATWIFKYA